MNQNLLHTEVQQFINNNLNKAIDKILFKRSPFKEVTTQELVEQIESKKRAEKKLPTWFRTSNIYYPNKLNIEQTSSEITAAYKSQLVAGRTLIDLTGGFGVDTYYFAKCFDQVVHCEINTLLSEMVQHNYNQLQISNVKVVASDGIDYLKHANKKFDCIYIDPSRRDNLKGKVFLLKDCEPDVPAHIDTLFTSSDILFIKVSPMLDITQGINELKYVKEVHVVAVDNEVKELLFLLQKGFSGNISIHTVNLKNNQPEAFNASYQSGALADFSSPLTYLYEPNAAILKAGFFNEVSQQLNIFKLHKNSHFYTSENLIEFPGRRFKIQQVLPYNVKQLSKMLPSKKANITTRNFPETVAQIRQKTKLKDGGDQYLFFTTDFDNKHVVLVCQKV